MPKQNLPTEYESHEAWRIKAIKLFGMNPNDWQWECPACRHVAKRSDWSNLLAPDGAVAFDCIGRYMRDTKVRKAIVEDGGPGPCDYKGNGGLNLNPVTIMIDGVKRRAFQFAPLEVD